MESKESFTIRKEHPGTKAARMLIGELDAYLDPLYPKESQHGYGIEKTGGPTGRVLRPIRKRCAGRLRRRAVFRRSKPTRTKATVKSSACTSAPSSEVGATPNKCSNTWKNRPVAGGFSKVRLETGISQPEAIGLYERYGYYKIPPFGDYWDDPLSFFYEKTLGN